VKESSVGISSCTFRKDLLSLLLPEMEVQEARSLFFLPFLLSRDAESLFSLSFR